MPPDFGRANYKCAGMRYVPRTLDHKAEITDLKFSFGATIPWISNMCQPCIHNIHNSVKGVFNSPSILPIRHIREDSFPASHTKERVNTICHQDNSSVMSRFIRETHLKGQI